MLEIKLGKNGMVALIDDEDYEKISHHSWCSVRMGNCYYAEGMIYDNGERKERTHMHRLIMNAQKGDIIDHIDHNGLNNQKNNLRFADRTTNAWNAISHTDSRIPYKGVSVFNHSYSRVDKHGRLRHYIYKDRYEAGIYKEGVKYRLGIYDTPEEAAMAYDIKAIELFGEFSRLNFPNMNYQKNAINPLTIV